jgi:rfaE bifunctional protein nucleotidyltransferase chain/domain
MIVDSLAAMSELMRNRRNAPLRWVLCHGVFDMCHGGHLFHLEWARNQGDRLIVSVAPDTSVAKGEGRPRVKQKERIRQLDNFNCVDYVVLNELVEASLLISELQPDVYVKGPDIERQPTPAFKEEKKVMEDLGGRVLFSPDSVEFHTTELLKARCPKCGTKIFE